MSFFSNLLKSEARKVISAAVDSGVSELLGNAKSVVSNEADCGGEAGLRNRLEAVFAEEWGSYEVRRQVPADTFGAPEGAWAYSYGLYKEGQPKAMFMVLNNKNHYKRKGVLAARSACLENGVAYMNFMSYLPNHREYISERLRKNITV